MSMLELKNVECTIDGRAILSGVSLSVEKGSIGCILGASGSGKTTLMRCIAGFHKISGEIVINHSLMSGEAIHIPTEQRKVGMVFQDHALFPHLSVEDNVAFGIHYLDPKQRQEKVQQLLEMMRMKPLAKRYPHEISGGQQQRVALARALAPDPQLLLLDEPFSNLDIDLKLQLTQEIREILKEKNITTLVVTHDQNEALAMSDMLGVMRDGKILQWGGTYDIYHNPNSITVATSVGIGKTIRGAIKDGMVQTVLGNFKLPSDNTLPHPIHDAKVLIRPDDIIHNDDSPQTAVIKKKQFRGAEFLYLLGLDNGEELYCFAPSHHNHRIGEKIGITTDIEHVVVFPSG